MAHFVSDARELCTPVSKRDSIVSFDNNGGVNVLVVVVLVVMLESMAKYYDIIAPEVELLMMAAHSIDRK